MSEYREHGSHHDGHHVRPQGGAVLAIVTVALLLLAIFQAIGVVRERFALGSARDAQQPAMEQALKLRAQLQDIATKTAALANAGDNAARDVLDLMHRKGVTISESAKPKTP